MDMSLDAQAAARKDRLAKLRNLKRKQEDGGDHDKEVDGGDDNVEASTVVLSGRNYDVQSKAPKLGFDIAPGADQETLETRAAEIASKTREVIAEEKNDKNIDLFSLQPKKPNWDLKRDVDRKLERLEARTNNAIARIVRDRILQAQAQSKGSHSMDSAATGVDESLVEAVRRREQEKDETIDDDGEYT